MAKHDLSPGARYFLQQAKDQGKDKLTDEQAASIALHLYGPGPLKVPARKSDPSACGSGSGAAGGAGPAKSRSAS